MPEPLTESPAANPTGLPATGTTIPPETGGAAPRLANGYEIGDEIARGGMGVVHRGRDISLNREVAIKLLQDRFPADGPTARRFVEEAQITGQLQHPGIPAVHHVGTLPDGRPFLAMKLIKGRTLDDLLKSSGGDEPRRSYVGVFEAIAQAVGYAHAHGVVHRDLKPANVMVGAFGEVQVMDWGLAKLLASVGASARRGSEVDNDATLGTEIKSLREADDATLSGSVLGTPAFMPPEQAIGAIDQIDARSDVFGLGAILCVILTGRPPYIAANAESTRQLAARAKLDEAFAALDVCQAEPDLVALCKRCLSAEKDNRPANAQAVAQEVAALRTAADERAKQAEIAQAAADVRAEEQRTRRRQFNVAAGIVAAVLLAGIAGSVWQWWRATVAETATGQQLVQTQKAEAEANAKTKQVEATLVIVGERTKLAQDAFGDMVFDMQNLLENRPGTQDLRRALLEKARTGLAKILADARKQGTPDTTLIASHIHMGDVEQQLGYTLAAQKEYQAGYELAQQLANADPKNAQAQRDLSVGLDRLGNVTLELGQTKDALDYYKKMNAIQQRLADADPKNAQGQRDLTVSFERLGDMTLQLGQTQDARDFYQKALTVCQRLANTDPKNAVAQRDLSVSFSRLGDVTLKLGQTQEALDFYQKMNAIAQRLADADPKNANAQRDLSASFENLGNVTLQLGQPTEARDFYQKMNAIQQRLTDADPKNAVAQRDLSVSFSRLGDVTLQLGQQKDALDFYQKSLTARQRLADADPKNAVAQQDLFISFYKLGVVTMANQEYGEAATWLSKAEQALKDFQTKGWFTKPDERLGTLSVREWQTDIAQQLATCRKAEQALADLDFALKQPAADVLGLLDIRVQVFAKKSDRKNLLATAAAYENLATADDHLCYNAACAWSLASGLVKDDAKLREEYAGKAMSLLRKTPTGIGHMFDSRAKLAAHMKQDADLNPLRARADFQKLLADLEKRHEPAPPPRAAR